jgi:hypothetical protein
MYVNRAFLSQVTNREDLLLSLSLFDDDTGQPIKLDGCTTANGLPFTASAWTVTDGTIVTTSATQLTIPVFPIGSQVSALALTVGTGLAINAGDPVTIKDTATGLNSMTGYVVSYASATGALVCQVGLTFQFEIRRGGPRNYGGGFVPWFDFGTPDDLGPLISASLGNGITVIDVGYVQIFIPEAQFKTLGSGTFSGSTTGTLNAAMTMTDSVSTRQIFLAELPVLYGGVTN